MVPDHTQRFDLPAALAVLPSLRALNAPGVRVADGVAWRACWTPDGPGTLRIAPEERAAVAQAWGPGAGWLVAQAPALVGAFDAGRDDFRPADPFCADLERQHRGLYLGRSGRLFDALVSGVFGQKVTGKEAGTQSRDLQRLLARPAPGPTAMLLPVSPSDLGSVGLPRLRGMGIDHQRASTLLRLAGLERQLQRLEGLDSDAARRGLLSIPGIGPWTAAAAIQTAFGAADEVQTGDYHLPNTVAWALAGEARADDARMLALLEPYRPHRGRLVGMIEAAGIAAPRYGPRMDVREMP